MVWRPYVDFTENMEQFPGVPSGSSVVFVLCFIHLSLGKCFNCVKCALFLRNSSQVVITFCCLRISAEQPSHLSPQFGLLFSKLLINTQKTNKPQNSPLQKHKPNIITYITFSFAEFHPAASLKSPTRVRRTRLCANTHVRPLEPRLLSN